MTLFHATPPRYESALDTGTSEIVQRCRHHSLVYANNIHCLFSLSFEMSEDMPIDVTTATAH